MEDLLISDLLSELLPETKRVVKQHLAVCSSCQLKARALSLAFGEEE